ncbi:MAG TPA: trypsin-like peptidase domain-containing protein [Pirellulales bacterium]|nr:trypsin-like peptidase domain-containing protein [Pirellulales bacterium]
MSRHRICIACVIVLLAAPAQGEPPVGSPRRTRDVEIIERVGPSVVALFSEQKDHNWTSGSGSIIHASGYILTNDHVVQDRQGVVLVRGLPPLPFRTVGRLWEKDLAIVKVDAPRPLVAVRLGRSHDIATGEPILAGGNPGGRGIVFSSGIVSSADVMPGTSALAMMYFPDDARDRFIQFDAASNPGNSGGPLINADGDQVAVVTAKILTEQAINYAIPIDRARQSINDLLLPEARGNFWTGIQLKMASAAIERIADESPAAAAGLRPGDVVTAVGNQPIADDIDFLIALVGQKKGDKLSVTILREDEKQTVSLALDEYPTKAGLSSEGKRAGLRYRVYGGRFGKFPDTKQLKVLDEGIVAEPRLDKIPNLPEDNYALALDGFIEIPADGVWSAAIGSDDGSRLYVDGELLADNDGAHPMQWSSGRRRWKKGLHSVRIEFFEATGEADLQVALVRDGSSERLQPAYFTDGEK